jgi:hypothetical protein
MMACPQQELHLEKKLFMIHKLQVLTTKFWLLFLKEEPMCSLCCNLSLICPNPTEGIVISLIPHDFDSDL